MEEMFSYIFVILYNLVVFLFFFYPFGTLFLTSFYHWQKDYQRSADIFSLSAFGMLGASGILLSPIFGKLSFLLGTAIYFWGGKMCFSLIAKKIKQKN